MNTAIGAYCHIEWRDIPNNVRPVFISFAQGCEEEGYDEFGTPDTKIFYFCPDGEEELKRLMSKESGEDFIVHDYEVEWVSQINGQENI